MTRKSPFRRAAIAALTPVLLTGAGVGASGGAAYAATASVPGWRVFDTTSVKSGEFWQSGIIAVNPSDAWAFGRRITPALPPDDSTQAIKHWNGHKWRFVPLTGPAAKPSVSFGATATAALSPADVWAFTLDSWMHWNGKHWASGKMPVVPSTQEAITGATIVSRDDIWVVGNLETASTAPYLAHYNGRKWTASTLKQFAKLTSVSATSASNVWAVGNGPRALLLHFNGRGWKTFATPKLISEFGLYNNVLAQPGGGVWVTGDLTTTSSSLAGGAMHWDGHHWTVYDLTSKDSVWAASLDGHGGIWAVTGAGAAPRFWHFTGGRWFGSSATGSASTADFIYQLSVVPKSSSMWAAGYVIDSGRQAGTILLHGPVP